MDKINKLSLPTTIIIASLVLGGFFYASQVNKQKSIERQQEIKLQEDRQQQVNKQKSIERQQEIKLQEDRQQQEIKLQEDRQQEIKLQEDRQQQEIKLQEDRQQQDFKNTLDQLKLKQDECEALSTGVKKKWNNVVGVKYDNNLSDECVVIYTDPKTGEIETSPLRLMQNAK